MGPSRGSDAGVWQPVSCDLIRAEGNSWSLELRFSMAQLSSPYLCNSFKAQRKFSAPPMPQVCSRKLNTNTVSAPAYTSPGDDCPYSSGYTEKGHQSDFPSLLLVCPLTQTIFPALENVWRRKTVLPLLPASPLLMFFKSER